MNGRVTLGEVEVLVTPAENLKLEGDELRNALTLHQFETQVAADQREASALGFHAVPAFVANRRAALTGVQAVSALPALLDRAI